jgi:hypothetical protein
MSKYILPLIEAWDLKKTEAGDALFSHESHDHYPSLRAENLLISHKNLADMVRISGLFMEECVTFTPEQELLYETIAAVMVLSKWKDIGELKDPILAIYKEALASEQFASLKTELIEQRDVIKQEVEAFLSGQEVLSPTSQNISNHLSILKKAIDKKNDPLSLEGIDIRQVQSDYASNKLYNVCQHDLLCKYASDSVEQAVSQKLLQRATLYPSDAADVAHFILTGPPAAGKSSSRAKLQAECNALGVRWDEVLEMSGDDRRDLLALIYKDLYGLDLTAENVMSDNRIVKNRIADALGALLDEGLSRPICHDEAAAIRTMQFANLAMRGNTPLHVLHIDIPSEVSVERAFKRYQETGRVTPTLEIYSSHREFPEMVLKFLETVAGKEVSYELLDGNIPKGEQPIPILTVDALKRTVTVHDLEKTEAFFTKAGIRDIRVKPSPELSSWEEVVSDVHTKLYDGKGKDAVLSPPWKRRVSEHYTLHINAPEACSAQNTEHLSNVEAIQHAARMLP